MYKAVCVWGGGGGVCVCVCVGRWMDASSSVYGPNAHHLVKGVNHGAAGGSLGSVCRGPKTASDQRSRTLIHFQRFSKKKKGPAATE